MILKLFLFLWSIPLFSIVGILHPDFADEEAISIDIKKDLKCAYDFNLSPVENPENCLLQTLKTGVDSHGFKVFAKTEKSYTLMNSKNEKIVIAINGIFQTVDEVLSQSTKLKFTEPVVRELYEGPSLTSTKIIFPLNDDLKVLKYVKLPRKSKGQPVALSPLYLRPKLGLSIFSVSFSNVKNWIFSLVDNPEKQEFEQDQFIPVFAEKDGFVKVLFDYYGFMKMRSPSIYSRLEYNSWGLPVIWLNAKSLLKVSETVDEKRLVHHLQKHQKSFQVPRFDIVVLQRRIVDGDIWLKVEVDPRNSCHSEFGAIRKMVGWLPLKSSENKYNFEQDIEEKVCSNEV